MVFYTTYLFIYLFIYYFIYLLTGIYLYLFIYLFNGLLHYISTGHLYEYAIQILCLLFSLVFYYQTAIHAMICCCLCILCLVII